LESYLVYPSIVCSEEPNLGSYDFKKSAILDIPIPLLTTSNILELKA
jgi:hypothetical protein